MIHGNSGAYTRSRHSSQQQVAEEFRLFNKGSTNSIPKEALLCAGAAPSLQLARVEPPSFFFFVPLPYQA
jgi:hypothetical protein